MIQQCEFCAEPAKWRFFKAEYERFCCNRHIKWTRRLIFLDLGQQTYQFEPADSDSSTENARN